MIKSYRYRLNPNKEQKIFFEKSFGCTRYVYNWALNKRITAYQADKTRISCVDLCKMLTPLKKEEDKLWLNEVSNECLQQSIRNMDAAFTRFFREKHGFPKFKSKHDNRKSYKAINGVRIDFHKHKIKLPKIGWIKFFKNQTFIGKIGTATISKALTNKYYVSIVVDDNIPILEKPEIKESTSVGIDVGIKDFAVLSNGEVFANPKFLENNSKRLHILQKRLAKKQKGSNRRNTARLHVAKQYEKITNKRQDFLHKVSKKIISENQTIIIEDLNIDGMLKNHHLARSISSASWSEFFRMLQYKAEWNGNNIVRIGRFDPSSKMCACGYINKDLKLSDRYWTCPQCGAVNDRDLLAAQNIKRFGLQEQNLIRYSPVVSGEEDAELPAMAGAVKRQYVEV